MNFADKLRNTEKVDYEAQVRETKRREQEQRLKELYNSFDIIINEWYADIKKACILMAEKGGNKVDISLENFIRYRYDFEYCHMYGTGIMFINPCDECDFWKKVRNYFFHVNMKDAEGNRIASWLGLEEEYLIYFKNEIMKKLENDGLIVRNITTPSTQLYTLQSVYEKYTSAVERFMFGGEGRYVDKLFEDKMIYRLNFEISW